MALQLAGLDGVQNMGNIGDITTPTSTQLYPLGFTRMFKDVSGTTVQERFTKSVSLSWSGTATHNGG